MGDVLHNCPRCSDDLPWGATSCHCGWKKRARGDGKKLASRVPVQCAYHDCPDDATIRIRTPTGWADLCRGHYVAHHQRIADAYCANAGLNTLEQKRWFCRQGMAAIGSLTPERWMDTIKQRAVDIMVRSGLDERALERMRSAGIIDEINHVIEPGARDPKKALPAPTMEAA